MADDVPIVAEDDEQLQKRRPQAIPVNRERDAPPLSVANANPNAAIPLTTAAPQTAKPIPVLPSGKPYPVGRVAGIPGYENPPTAESPLGSVTPPHPVGVAQLASKAENIHNPFLRSLAKVGAYGARALDTAGTILAPRITEAIPGTTMNQAVKVGAQQRQEAEQTKEGLEKAETHNQEAEATERENAGPKLGTPEEQTFAYLLTQTDPETKKPYTPMAAFSAAQQAKQDVKPVKEGTPEAQTYDALLKQVNPATGTNYTQDEALQHIEQGKANAKPPQEKEADISDYLASHKLEDTPANREAARGAIATRNKPDAGNARADRSYNVQSARLDKLRTPVEQLATRFSRLTDTLNQASPQADALVAPELLSVMAGGQGSGVRMNEAEIARIVGGRSAWENLKASIQHWSTNPDDARSITPEQDKQIRALISTVHAKITAKQQVMDKAEESLVNTDDPKQHRQIVVGAQKSLDSIDAGMIRARDPQGNLHEAPPGTALPAGWKAE